MNYPHWNPDCLPHFPNSGQKLSRLAPRFTDQQVIDRYGKEKGESVMFHKRKLGLTESWLLVNAFECGCH